MPVLEVDQFTRPEARQEFHDRYDQLVQIIGTLGLQGVNSSETPAQAYGGAALVLQGIDAYITSDEPFDFEVITNEAMFTRIDNAHHLAARSGNTGSLLQRQGFVFPVDITAAITPDHERSWICGPYTGAVSEDVVMTPNGILASSATAIANHKTARPFVRVKDLAGIVKAHVVAMSTEPAHPITQDEAWLVSVSRAMDRLTRQDVRSRHDRRFFPPKPKYPSWVKQLIKVQFDHQAFENVPQPPR